MESEICSWKGLSAEDQSDVILYMVGWELWELESALYEVSVEDIRLVSNGVH